MAAQERKEWFENPEFWQRFAPVMFDGQRWAEAPAVAERVIALAQLSAGASVLDAGCGPGRISVELAARGLRVTGVDIIQAELDAAAESAAAEGVPIDLRREDLRSFRAETPFDCAVSLYTSFGYCDDPADDLKIIRNIADSVRDGGTFILESTSRETAALSFTEGEWFERSGLTVLTEFSVAGAWEGLRSRWILIDGADGSRYEHEFVQRLYSAPELRRHVLDAGFKSADIYGGFLGTPYDQDAQTMVIVAKK